MNTYVYIDILVNSMPLCALVERTGTFVCGCVHMCCVSTEGLAHARQMLYHPAISSTLRPGILYMITAELPKQSLSVTDTMLWASLFGTFEDQ